MDLPQELLRNIFISLDGASLVKCRRVCSSWLREVDRCELVPNFWKQRCIEEVSWDFLPNYIEKINPIYFEDNTVAFSWKDVYICWYRWKLLRKWPSKFKEMDIKRTGEIIRAEFYGNWIVYATNECNALIACHMASPAYAAKLLYEGARLKDFLFISSENPLRPCLGIVFINTERDCCFVDVQQRHAIGANFIPPSDNYWFREIILAKRDQLKAINPDIRVMEDHLLLPKSICNFNYHVFKDAVIRTKAKWIILHHKVALGISDTPDYQHVIVFVVGKKYKCYNPSVNFGNICTAKLHGNNLFVGTSNAMLHHYTIKNIQDFLDFDFYQFDWSIKVHEIQREEKIKSIDVCELYKRPYIAVAIGSCRIVIVDFMDDDKEVEQYFPNVLTAFD